MARRYWWWKKWNPALLQISHKTISILVLKVKLIHAHLQDEKLVHVLCIWGSHFVFGSSLLSNRQQAMSILTKRRSVVMLNMNSKLCACFLLQMMSKECYPQDCSIPRLAISTVYNCTVLLKRGGGVYKGHPRGWNACISWWRWQKKQVTYNFQHTHSVL